MPTNPSETRFVLPETRAIAIVGCFDLLATFFLIATHRAQEANPIMAGMLSQIGPAGLAAAKALFIAIPLTIAELARKKSPVFVPRALRIGLLAYLVMLVFAYRDPLIALIRR